MHVGIDLGTTNSLVAHLDGGVPKAIPDAEGRVLLPSIVAFTPDGVVVGEAARRQLARNPARTVYSVKRLMGKGYDDVKLFQPRALERVICDERTAQVARARSGACDARANAESARLTDGSGARRRSRAVSGLPVAGLR